MQQPRFSLALNWKNYEQAVIAVFTEALVRLAQENALSQGEEPINLTLYWKAREVHLEYLHAKASVPFVIEFDSTNQPEPDDTAKSRRLKKRPDFACALTNDQATDFRFSQVRYSLECKRLGDAEGRWVLNRNYTEHGMLRFRKADHSYAKACPSAAMIGYVQSMDNDELLKEVNKYANAAKVPSLTRAATAWVTKAVTCLIQPPLTRDCGPDPIRLRHLWVDLHHVTFVRPAPVPRRGLKQRSNPVSRRK